MHGNAIHILNNERAYASCILYKCKAGHLESGQFKRILKHGKKEVFEAHEIQVAGEKNINEFTLDKYLDAIQLR